MRIARTVKSEGENWDYLIILDACRYDYFARSYEHYLVGDLSKRISPGSSTRDWFLANFRGYHSDVVYISGNPWINGRLPVRGVDARQRFSKIVDVWYLGWDDALGTVPPEAINKASIEAAEAFPDKRLIIHYLQPHSPYLGKEFRGCGFPEPDIARGRVLRGYKTAQTSLRATLSSLLVYAKVLRNPYKFGEVVGAPPVSPLDAVLRTFGTEGLRRAYQENLVIALAHASRLCKYFLATYPTRRIVISADHGEQLGEKGLYGHSLHSNEPALREVPWFRVRGTVEGTEISDAQAS